MKQSSILLVKNEPLIFALFKQDAATADNEFVQATLRTGNELFNAIVKGDADTNGFLTQMVEFGMRMHLMMVKQVKEIMAAMDGSRGPKMAGGMGGGDFGRWGEESGGDQSWEDGSYEDGYEGFDGGYDMFGGSDGFGDFEGRDEYGGFNNMNGGHVHGGKGSKGGKGGKGGKGSKGGADGMGNGNFNGLNILLTTLIDGYEDDGSGFGWEMGSGGWPNGSQGGMDGLYIQLGNGGERNGGQGGGLGGLYNQLGKGGGQNGGQGGGLDVSFNQLGGLSGFFNQFSGGKKGKGGVKEGKGSKTSPTAPANAFLFTGSQNIPMGNG